MLAIHQRKPRGRRWLAGVIMVLLLIGASGWLVWYIVLRSPDVSPMSSSVSSKPLPQVVSLSSRMLVMGDVFWGRYINDWSMASDLRNAYPFQRLGEFERDTYDAWIADLECPVTNNPKVSSAVEDSTLAFDCSPDYLPEARKWFTAFSLANNHTDNQGAEGLIEMRQHLDTNSVQYFGTYDPEDTDHLCDVLSIPTRITMNDGTQQQGKLPLAWCGYHGVFRTPSPESLAVMKQFAQFNIIAMPHSGAEYKAEPDEIKTTWYRALIDSGADVVIGDHPHWVQSSEAYKGKLIMYSLGNFIFDQQFNSEVTRAAVLDMSVSVEAKDAPDLDKWLAIGERCASYQDSCKQLAADQRLTKLPLRYHFAVEGSDNSGKLVKKATTAQLDSIRQRLRWQQTISGLSGLYSGE